MAGISSGCDMNQLLEQWQQASLQESHTYKQVRSLRYPQCSRTFQCRYRNRYQNRKQQCLCLSWAVPWQGASLDRLLASCLESSPWQGSRSNATCLSHSCPSSSILLRSLTSSCLASPVPSISDWGTTPPRLASSDPPNLLLQWESTLSWRSPR